jgi:hypothetical protein
LNRFDPSGLVGLAIELKIVVAVIGILTALSVQNYVERQYHSPALGIFCGALAGVFVAAFALGIAYYGLLAASTPAAPRIAEKAKDIEEISEATMARYYNAIKEAIAEGKVGQVIKEGEKFAKDPRGRYALIETYWYGLRQAASGGFSYERQYILNAIEQMLGRK